MFFDGALGHAHNLCYVGIRTAVDAVQQKDVARALRQTAQGGLDLAQIIARLQCGLRFAAVRIRFTLPRR